MRAPFAERERTSSGALEFDSNRSAQLAEESPDNLIAACRAMGSLLDFAPFERLS